MTKLAQKENKKARIQKYLSAFRFLNQHQIFLSKVTNFPSSCIVYIWQNLQQVGNAKVACKTYCNLTFYSHSMLAHDRSVIAERIKCCVTWSTLENWRFIYSTFFSFFVSGFLYMIIWLNKVPFVMAPRTEPITT